MFEIKLTVTNDIQRANAQYVSDHIEQYLYNFNGAYITIFDGDQSAIDVPAKYENQPEIIRLWHSVFDPVDVD